jgi:hypothetical protein
MNSLIGSQAALTGFGSKTTLAMTAVTVSRAISWRCGLRASDFDPPLQSGTYFSVPVSVLQPKGHEGLHIIRADDEDDQGSLLKVSSSSNKCNDHAEGNIQLKDEKWPSKSP